MLTASPAVHVSYATPPDFPILARILPLANASNPIHHLMFVPESSVTHSVPPSVKWSLSQFSAAERYHLKPREPRTYILKAVPLGQNTAVGYAIVKVFDWDMNDREHIAKKYETADEEESKRSNLSDELPDSEATFDQEPIEAATLETEFYTVYTNKLKDAYARHMSGKRHACKFYQFKLARAPRTCHILNAFFRSSTILQRKTF